jgi:hypothetical protein
MNRDRAHLTWEGGGLARFLSANEKAATLLSTVPTPPGSRISGALVALPSVVVRVKVHACRAESSGYFRIEGRPLDLTRDIRARIEALAAEMP